MPKAVIVDAVRTAIGKRNGALRNTHPVDLGAAVLKGLIDRKGLDPAMLDDILFGCVVQAGEQSSNIARWSALAAGLPESVPGTTIDRACGSSQQAIVFAFASVEAGHYDIAIAGGVESMTRVPMGSNRAHGPGKAFGPTIFEKYGRESFSQGEGAEILAKKWNLSRTELDQIALDSHARAQAATLSGKFSDHIIPVSGTDEDGHDFVFDTDQGIRTGGTLESLAKLSPAFLEEGVITAGNSSQISDGAAALLIMSEEKAKQLGFTPIASLHTTSLAGVDPITMLDAPIPATQKVLNTSGLDAKDIGVFEVNEAFASVPAAWMKEVGVSWEKVNPNGGAIALGHPLGGSGARIMTDLIHNMRKSNIKYGLQTMCEAGGQANASILELAS